MARDRYNFYFSFWATFYPLTPLKAYKIKIKKKRKKGLEIPSFYTCTKNHDHMVHDS